MDFGAIPCEWMDYIWLTQDSFQEQAFANTVSNLRVP
jgi:hypothetical protein